MSRRRQLRQMTEAERSELERLAHSRTEEVRLVERSRAILAVYAGEKIQTVAFRNRSPCCDGQRMAYRFEGEGVKRTAR